MTVLQALPPGSEKSTTRIVWPHFPRFAWAGVVVAVFVIVIGYDFLTTYKFEPATFSSLQKDPSFSSGGGLQQRVETETKKEIGKMRRNSSAQPRAQQESVAQNFGLGATADSADLDTGTAQKMYPAYPEPPRPTSVPITDTREFLKIGYSAIIKTRRVQEIGNRVATIVRGHGGRVDTLSLDKRYGYLTFVVPKATFVSFKTELQSVIGPRFLIEGVQEHNRLPEKQWIEEQTVTTESTLATLRNDRQSLINHHDTTVASLNRQIALVKKNITALDEELREHPERAEEIAIRKKELMGEKGRLESRLRNENAHFTQSLNALDAQIRGAESTLTHLGRQDQALVDDVATVEGSISLQWITLTAIIKLYVIDYWYGFLLVLPVVYVFRHRPRALELP